VPGLVTTYTLTALNNGASTVTGAVVNDPLPAGVSASAWTCQASAGSTCTPSGTGALSDSVTLLAGGSATYTLMATVNPFATGTLVNSASLLPPGTVSDTNTANNFASDTDTLTPQADLAVQLTDSRDPVVQGSAYSYALSVTNNGPSASTGGTVSQTVPAGI